MTTTAQDEFLNTHADSGVLTPEQAAQLLELGEQGDTGKQPEQAVVPAAAAEGGGEKPEGEAKDAKTEPNDKPQGEAAPTTDDEPKDPSKAVILAKDGVHTIEFQKLVDAREDAKQWRTRAEAAQHELDALKAQAEQRAAAGEAPTKVDKQVEVAQAAIDQGADPSLFGDFSEEALAKGIDAIVEQRVNARLAAAVDAKVEAALKPFQQQQAATAHDEHLRAIYAKHPDADSIAESKELGDWIAKQPSFVQAGYRDVLAKGGTAAVIELFDAFKADKQGTQAAADATPAGVVKAQAKAAIAAAAEKVPNSLSDIPGGRSGPSNPDEAIASLSGPDMAERMASMTPAQIEAYLNRHI